MMELTAQPRIIIGKKTKNIRADGLLPAVLYGEGIGARTIAVATRDFEKIYARAGESTLLKLTLEGIPHTVLIHDIASDPLRGHAIHADFYAVRMDKTLRVAVPIVFFGDSPAVKNEGGILVKVMHEMEVEALPENLPHELRADLGLLTSLKSRILAGDMAHDPSVKIIARADEIVALVEEPRVEEEPAVPTEAGVKEVQTERELKKAEEQSKKAAAQEA